MLGRMVKEKYSVGEFERRFLLTDRPADATNPRRIVDRYIDGTRLRLRTVDEDGAEPVRKLGHKRRVAVDDPTAVMNTSLYLDDGEFAVLAALPGRRLAKTRWAVDLDGRTGAVDVFEEALQGLILLEVDLGRAAELDRFVAPPWVGPEVTRVEAFTGGSLAGRSYDDLAPVMASVVAGPGRAE